MNDLNANNIEVAMNMMVGSARSMGLTVGSDGHGNSENATRPHATASTAKRPTRSARRLSCVKERAKANSTRPSRRDNLNVDPTHADQIVRGG